MQSFPSGLRTHSQKVCSYYKRAARNFEDWYSSDFAFGRGYIRQLRKELDENASIKDLRVAKELLLKAEAVLDRGLHCQPRKFPSSPGGVAYERHVVPPDWVLDYWHPVEKAFYPKYFALREKRKLEYVKFFDKHYPNALKKFEPEH